VIGSKEAGQRNFTAGGSTAEGAGAVQHRTKLAFHRYSPKQI
jgi:hypothetical protein